MIIKARGKGHLVLAIGIGSFVGLYLCWRLIVKWFGVNSGPFDFRIVSSLSLILAGALNYYFTRNYITNPDGETEYYEPEGTLMFIGVTLWTRIYFALGILTPLGAIADKYKW
jgi:hypothetical protein